ncbi:thioesterase II family protein [Streptomyces sp. S186]|uniref:thioesterase II family protein n=1 Tax=Streptomyces sp. S186 TaxID=3434395 RepID=UPI003F66C6A2
MRERQRASQPVTLYCFPHAGAGISAFRDWPGRTGPGTEPVPVKLPGRAGRRREAPVRGAADILADLRHLVTAAPDRPYALYGHSLGGLIAHGLGVALERAGLPGPALVAVGACAPPDAAAPLADCAELPEDELLDRLATLGALPADGAPAESWRRLVLPALRDDLRLAGRLRAAADGPLTAPLLAVSGAADPVAGPEVMAGWRSWSTGRVVERTLPGGHFFVRGPELPRLLGRACRVVARMAAPRVLDPVAHR